jgi:hypothetical protein
VKKIEELGLIESHNPTTSVIYYRDKIEDFVFSQHELEMTEIRIKLKKKEAILLHSGEEIQKHQHILSRYKNQLKYLDDLKKAFTVLLRYTVKIPANERILDAERILKNTVLKIFSAYDFDTQGLLPQPNSIQGKQFTQYIIQRGFLKEYPKITFYTITPLGIEIAQQLRNQKTKEICPEEVEFEKLMQQFGHNDQLK